MNQSTSDKQLEVAANAAAAAKEAADAAVAVERARFYIVIRANSIDQSIAAAKISPASPEMYDKAVHSPTVGYVFKNYGKTPAIIKKVYYGTIVVQEHPPIPVYLFL